MTPVGRQLLDAASYVVFLGQAGNRRPTWAIVVWWLLMFVALGLVYLSLNGIEWGRWWPALLLAQVLVLWVSKPGRSG